MFHTHLKKVVYHNKLYVVCITLTTFKVLMVSIKYVYTMYDTYIK